jgi:sec-independent protein translocase protein TatB
MFDVGFSELLVIGIVALLVIGPEKLPSVARTVGALLGRMQRYVNDVKADINREIELDELKKLQTTVQDAAKSIETSMSDTMAGFQTQADELNKIASAEPAAATASTDSAPETASATEPTANETAAQTVFHQPAESVSQSGSQGSLPLEAAPTNVSGEVAEVKLAAPAAPAVHTT